MRWAPPTPLVLVLVLSFPPIISADLNDVVRCQNRIAHAGARYAKRSVRAAVICAMAIFECQAACDQGVYGPPCGEPPEPGCCDVDDPNSNSAYAACLAGAEVTCDVQALRIQEEEIRKQAKIIRGCEDLTPEELCGSQAPGLNFETLNAGCAALDPNYVCDLDGMLECVGGPLERVMTDQITALLIPRAQEGIALLGLEESFPGIPITRKVKESLDAGRADIWSINGKAGDLIKVKVKPKDDDNDGIATLDLAVFLLEMDGLTPVANTTVYNPSCVTTPCGGGCPQFERHLPYSGTFFLVVEAQEATGCPGGPYRLKVTSPGGLATPILQANDVSPPVSPP